MKKARSIANRTRSPGGKRVTAAYILGACGVLLALSAPFIPVRMFERTTHQASLSSTGTTMDTEDRGASVHYAVAYPYGAGVTTFTYLYARSAAWQVSDYCLVAAFALLTGPTLLAGVRRELTRRASQPAT